MILKHNCSLSAKKKSIYNLDLNSLNCALAKIVFSKQGQVLSINVFSSDVIESLNHNFSSTQVLGAVADFCDRFLLLI